MSFRYNIRCAEPTDSEALLTLFEQTPQDGNIRLNFERQPNFFHATQVVTSDAEVWLMEDLTEELLIAAFSIGKREVYVNGEKQLIRYSNDLRIHPDYMGGRTLFRLFKKYKELMQNEWMQTVILDENKASIDTVGSGRLTLPTYYHAGQFITHMVALNKSYPSANNSVRRASQDDIPLLQKFFDRHAKNKEFYPHYDFSKIGSNDSYYRELNINDYFLQFDQGDLVGVIGCWNQKSFKQTRFLSYHGKLRFLRHIYNLSSQLFGGLRLPKPGDLASYLSLHSVLIKDNNVSIFKNILLAVLAEYKTSKAQSSNFDAVIVGFDKRDPLHSALENMNSHRLVSNHYLASYDAPPDFFSKQESTNSTPLFYLEPSRL